MVWFSRSSRVSRHGLADPASNRGRRRSDQVADQRPDDSGSGRPKARDVLSACARGDWSKEAFPWLSVRECFVGFSPATVLGISFSGELAYEIHVPNASLYAAYLALRAAGETYGLKLFGARAVDSMRLEKGFMHWKADLLTEFDPFETALDRFVKLDKDADFIGKEALKKRHAAGPNKILVSLKVDATHAPAHSGASLMRGDNVVGTIHLGRLGLSRGHEPCLCLCRTGFGNKRLHHGSGPVRRSRCGHGHCAVTL